jgi:hypothetical protein
MWLFSLKRSFRGLLEVLRLGNRRQSLQPLRRNLAGRMLVFHTPSVRDGPPDEWDPAFARSARTRGVVAGRGGSGVVVDTGFGIWPVVA